MEAKSHKTQAIYLTTITDITEQKITDRTNDFEILYFEVVGQNNNDSHKTRNLLIGYTHRLNDGI